jgi:DNA-binding transcriptional ArsR family regulator
MAQPRAEKVARIGRALAHPVRVELIALLLASEEVTPGALARELEETDAAIDRQVHYLRSLEVVELRDEVQPHGTVKQLCSLRAELRGPLMAVCTVRTAA